MNFKKLAAILAALMILMTFTACGDTGSESPASSGDQALPENIPAVSGDTDSGDVPEIVPAVPTLTINGETIDTDGISMMTINGYEVPFDEFRYTYMALDNNYFSFGDPAYWEANPDAFPIFIEYLEHSLIEDNWGVLIARDYGVELTDDDKKQIDDALVSQREQFESDEAYENALLQTGFTEDLLRRVIEKQVTNNRVYLDLFGTEGAPYAPTDDEVRENLSKDYVRVYHVLVNFDHFSGEEGYEDATEDELKAAAKEYAEELLEQIKGGADIYELAQTADDPGMVGNEDGYFFTYGEMVEPFEEKSFEMEVGEISDLVETDYGYHIIQKLETEQYIEDNFDTVKNDYINRSFNQFIDDYLADAEIVHSEYFDNLGYDSVK